MLINLQILLLIIQVYQKGNILYLNGVEEEFIILLELITII